HSPDIGRLIEGNIGINERSVNAGSQANRSGITPPPYLPVALVIVFNDLDTVHPFTVLHAIDARNEHTGRKAMTLGQNSSVHAHSQQGSRFEGFVQVNAIAIAVDGVKD